MVISDPRFGGQVVSKKGKVLLFDSTNCLHEHLRAHDNSEAKLFFADSLHKGEWLASEEAYFGLLPNVRSPMGAGIVAVRSRDEYAMLTVVSGDSKTSNLEGVMQWEKLMSELSAGRFK
jgi:copper chaperone NosL